MQQKPNLVFIDFTGYNQQLVMSRVVEVKKNNGKRTILGCRLDATHPLISTMTTTSPNMEDTPATGPPSNAQESLPPDFNQ